MPYTDDPEHVPADQVRFLLGDTDNKALDLTDNEVAYLLAENGDSTLRAAARGAENLAAKFARTSQERRVGPLLLRESSGTGQGKAQRFVKLAEALWNRITSTSGAPFAGGISRTDKQVRQLDSDRVKPNFARRMQDYQPGVPGTRESDLLG